VRELRIDFAREQLAGHAPLSDIAAAAGFYDQSHFSRCFKRHVGVTPAAYRSECQMPNAKCKMQSAKCKM